MLYLISDHIVQVSQLDLFAHCVQVSFENRRFINFCSHNLP